MTGVLWLRAYIYFGALVFIKAWQRKAATTQAVWHIETGEAEMMMDSCFAMARACSRSDSRAGEALGGCPDRGPIGRAFSCFDRGSAPRAASHAHVGLSVCRGVWALNPKRCGPPAQPASDHSAVVQAGRGAGPWACRTKGTDRGQLGSVCGTLCMGEQSFDAGLDQVVLIHKKRLRVNPYLV